jgi:uncharacterized DUF497 family protein
MKFTILLFTAHGKKRAAERGITPEEINGLLASEKTLMVPSSTDSRAFLAMGKASGKHWVVVCSKETGAVITVRRADKKERRFYEEKTRN